MNINEEILKLDWDRDPYGLYEPIEYTLASGGKRVRPQLAMIASQMFGGRDEDVLPAALALEVFHNFTLLHDDVMDKAEVRRGRPTVHMKWNESTAILSGDQMLIEAYKLLSGVPRRKLAKVLEMFNDMATEICEGQQYDMDFETMNRVKEYQYFEMIGKKTAALLGYALKIGAYIAGAKKKEQDLLYSFGIGIGFAFQLQDDILDVWGAPETFGKAIGGDICCNKKSIVSITALDMADEESCKELNYWFGQILEDNTEKIAKVTAIYDRLGVREHCEKGVKRLIDSALRSLSLLPQNEATEQLRQLANKLNARKN
ncbi:MAG: polyprenyl synthetase family protein [Paludibacteraceae bacterium]|nr:polyprenyl synthetase family protein [Paludibacteraceae bacterium]